MMRFLYVVLIAVALAEIGDSKITGWTGPVSFDPDMADVTGTNAPVSENTQESVHITFVAETDKASITYGITSQDPVDVFTIDAQSGVLTVIVGKVLDYETHTSHSVIVSATDNESGKGTATFTIPIADVNDNAPAFAQSSYTVNIPDSSPAGTAVITVMATDEDGSPANNEIKSYSFGGTSNTNDDFAVAVNGAINVAKELSAERTATYALVVEAVDGGDLKGSTTVNVCVGCDNGKGVLCVSLLLVLASALLGIQQNVRFV